MTNSSDSMDDLKEKERHLESIDPQPSESKTQIQAMIQEVGFMAMQRGSRGSVDISKLDKDQMDAVLGILAENERNAHTLNMKKLDVTTQIELRRIDASVMNQKTLRISLVVALIALPIITILVLFFKEKFFIPWLTFLTGMAGGFGLSKVTNSVFKSNTIKGGSGENEG